MINTGNSGIPRLYYNSLHPNSSVPCDRVRGGHLPTVKHGSDGCWWRGYGATAPGSGSSRDVLEISREVQVFTLSFPPPAVQGLPRQITAAKRAAKEPRSDSHRLG